MADGMALPWIEKLFDEQVMDVRYPGGSIARNWIAMELVPWLALVFLR